MAVEGGQVTDSCCGGACCLSLRYTVASLYDLRRLASSWCRGEGFAQTGQRSGRSQRAPIRTLPTLPDDHLAANKFRENCGENIDN